jgi:hypothetical protein
MFVIAGIATVLSAWIEMVRIIESGHRCTATTGTYCASNMRNVVLAALQYANEHAAFPIGTWPNSELAPERRLSWYAPLLPYLEMQELRDSIDINQPWYSLTNDPVACTQIDFLNCPEPPRAVPGAPATTSYIGIAGVGIDAPVLPQGHPRAGVFGYERQTTLADIKDGAACTMVLAESGRVATSWLAGGPATVRGLDPAEQPYIGPGRQFAGIHAVRVMNAAFADGSIRAFRESVDPRILEALSTIAGGETLPSDMFP